MDHINYINFVLTISLYTMCASMWFFPFNIKRTKLGNTLYFIFVILGYIGIYELYNKLGV